VSCSSPIAAACPLTTPRRRSKMMVGKPLKWPLELCRWCGEEVRIEPVNNEGGCT
jgi:hypothetical protein